MAFLRAICIMLRRTTGAASQPQTVPRRQSPPNAVRLLRRRRKRTLPIPVYTTSRTFPTEYDPLWNTASVPCVARTHNNTKAMKERVPRSALYYLGAHRTSNALIVQQDISVDHLLCGESILDAFMPPHPTSPPS